MPFYANACRVKNQRICSSQTRRKQPVSSQITLKLTAGDLGDSGGDARAGFSTGAGPPPGGSLNPASISGMEISYIDTI